MATRRHANPLNQTLLAVVAVAGFGGSVALVGAGSAGPHRAGGSSAADTVVITLAVLIGVSALTFATFVAWRIRRPRIADAGSEESDDSLPGFVWQPLLAPLLSTLLLLLACAILVGPCLRDEDSEPLPRRPERSTTTSVQPTDHTRASPPTTPDWTIVTGIVLAAAGLLLAAMAAHNRRGPVEQPDDHALEDDIALSLADLDSLDHDPDHRRVVIRTYARMEQALARSGVPRKPWETPQEFLLRALASLGTGSTAARRLTDLFEQARFSTHVVDEAMRAEAADALRAVRDEIIDVATQRPRS